MGGHEKACIKSTGGQKNSCNIIWTWGHTSCCSIIKLLTCSAQLWDGFQTAAAASEQRQWCRSCLFPRPVFRSQAIRGSESVGHVATSSPGEMDVTVRWLEGFFKKVLLLCFVIKQNTYWSVGEHHVFEGEGFTRCISSQLHCIIFKCNTALWWPILETFFLVGIVR